MADEEFLEEGLRVHNEYRSRHGVPDLSLSSELCDYANEWATILTSEGRFEHRTDKQYGENLYYMWSSSSEPPSAKDACDKWYSEIKDYCFGQQDTGSSGHFTQMIWRDSTELGMGVATDESGKIIIVANYNPPGNYDGQFEENVPMPYE